MTNQTIEQAVEEFEEKFGSADYGINKFRQFDTDGIFLQDGTDWLRQALQAQREAGAEEERVNIIEIVRFTKFRDNQPQESYHKYLQQTKGVNYIRNKILQALTPPTK